MKTIKQLLVITAGILFTTAAIAQQKKEYKKMGCATIEPSQIFAFDTTETGKR
ncbi:MAG: hypothetical protein H3C56_09160, partial [Chitinophagaceae bacterium]|nr:hypothetical protein [Chitinophagaceae bacterium]